MQQIFQSYPTAVVAILSLAIWVAIPTVIAIQKGRDWKMWSTFSVVLPIICIFAATQNEDTEKLWLCLSAFTPLFSLLILSALPQKNPVEGDQSNEIISNEHNLRKRANLSGSADLEAPSIGASVMEENRRVTIRKGKGAMQSNSDATRILQNETWKEILDATLMHFKELIEKHGHHEDYERDACSELVYPGSPFSRWFGAAYEDQTGEPYSEEESIRFDDLRGFAFSQNDEFIFNFLMNYLSAMRRNGSKLPGISKVESKKWKPMVEASLAKTIKVVSEA